MTDPHPLLRFVSLLSIAHHIPGRIRLKLAAKDTDLADAIAQAKRFGRLVTEAPGIRSVNVNLLARSCVVEYDADRIPPAAWGGSAGRHALGRRRPSAAGAHPSRRGRLKAGRRRFTQGDTPCFPCSHSRPA
ncbi:HMA2 domain-containing protein [Azospirillum doebereinerae]|uniref:HMA2 domain-containing protein n=1 Tax=Azospirillum doebereinerae TaxID=92933 RepID=UPI0038507A9D